MVLTIQDIEGMTIKDGETWGYPHVCRVLKLSEIIGAGMDYDHTLMRWIVNMHDWGAYPRYRQPDVEHALRSREIVEAEILPQTDFNERQKALILDAIEKHDYRDFRPVHTNEALLLREADFLDFLGVVGIAREFARGPNHLKVSYDAILKRRGIIESRFTLPKACEMAQKRLKEMAQFLTLLEADSFEFM